MGRKRDPESERTGLTVIDGGAKTAPEARESKLADAHSDTISDDELIAEMRAIAKDMLDQWVDGRWPLGSGESRADALGKIAEATGIVIDTSRLVADELPRRARRA